MADAAQVYSPDSREQRRYENRGWLTCHRCVRVGTEYELRHDDFRDKPCDRGRGCALLALEVTRGR